MNRAQRRAAARRAKRCTVCQAQVREERLRRHMLRHGIDIDAAEKADALAHLSQAQIDAGMDRLIAAIDRSAPRHEDCTECRGNGSVLCPDCNGGGIGPDGGTFGECRSCESGEIECRSDIHDAAMAAAAAGVTS